VKNRSTIQAIVFAAIFFGVMSVSFLVEARDVPEGTTVKATGVDEVFGPPAPLAYEFPYDEIRNGVASWYGGRFHGRTTASGRRYDMHELTAAHKTLPFGTLLRVENAETGEAVVVEVTDRGPYVHQRVVDLSKAAAQIIGVGVTSVRLDGVRPESIRSFYEGNDSMVVTITPDMHIEVRSASTIREEKKAGSYTKAMRLTDANEVVVVRTNDEGDLLYSVATIASSPIALVD
jgi:rare lipoprotein A